MHGTRPLRWLAASVVAALAFSIPGYADDEKPSATIEIQQYQVAFIGSGSLGGGTLGFQGKQHEFSIGGLGIGGFGVSSIDATGEVYHLEKLDDFPGAYAQARAGVVAADKSKGSLWLRNTHGVYIRVSAKREGLMLALGADGVYIDLK
jgi:hypothetical protein